MEDFLDTWGKDHFGSSRRWCTLHTKYREVGIALNVSVHDRGGGGLRDVCEIVPGIRNLGNLLLVHGC